MVKNSFIIFLCVFLFTACKKEPAFPELKVTGTDSLKVGQTYIFSVTPVDGAIYNWQGPAYIQITEGQGTCRIHALVMPQFSIGDLCVSVSNKYHSKQACKTIINKLYSNYIKVIGNVGTGRCYSFIFPLDGKLFFGGGTTNFPSPTTCLSSGAMNNLNDFFILDTVSYFISLNSSTGPINAKREGGTYFTYGSKGYYGFGLKGNTVAYARDLWEFDGLSNTWSQKASNLSLGVQDGRSFVINGEAYLFGGSDSTCFYNDKIWKYNISLNTWFTWILSVETQNSGHPAFSYNGLGYLIGGFDGVNNNKVYKYIPLDEAWYQLGVFPGTIRDDGFGFLIGNKYYYGGGMDASGNYLLDFWEWDIATNTWLLKGNLPYGIVSAAYCTNNGKGYIFGGWIKHNGKTYLNDAILEFKPN